MCKHSDVIFTRFITTNIGVSIKFSVSFRSKRTIYQAFKKNINYVCLLHCSSFLSLRSITPLNQSNIFFVLFWSSLIIFDILNYLALHHPCIMICKKVECACYYQLNTLIIGGVTLRRMFWISTKLKKVQSEAEMQKSEKGIMS